SPGSVGRNSDQTTSDLNFNDAGYERLPSTLAFNGIFSQEDNSTTLGYARPAASLLEPVNTRGLVQATAFDELPAQATATVAGIEVKLNTIRPSVLSNPIVSTILKGKRGWAKLAPGAPIFAWYSNTPNGSFLTTPGSPNWTGGFNG